MTIIIMYSIVQRSMDALRCDGQMRRHRRVRPFLGCTLSDLHWLEYAARSAVFCRISPFDKNFIVQILAPSWLKGMIKTGAARDVLFQRVSLCPSRCQFVRWSSMPSAEAVLVCAYLRGNSTQIWSISIFLNYAWGWKSFAQFKDAENRSNRLNTLRLLNHVKSIFFADRYNMPVPSRAP